MDGVRISAVIFDLDGTLLDTERATGGVLREFLEKYGKVLDPDKEVKRLGQMHKESAKAIVEDYELPMTAEQYSLSIMPIYQQRWSQAQALPGVYRLIQHLHKHGVPLGLASNSIKRHIGIKISHQQEIIQSQSEFDYWVRSFLFANSNFNGWKEMFSVVIGGDEVSHGKPSPDIFLEAARRLGSDASSCLVIEDSPVGVRAAKDAGTTVVAVPSLQNQAEHYSIANNVLRSLLEFQPELWGLAPFEDWVQNALPIEPLYAKGLIREAVAQNNCVILSIDPNNGSFDTLPDQISGIFFGWAKLQIQGIFKMVAAVSWDLSTGFSRRMIKPCILGEINNIFMEPLDLVFVGYVRKLFDEETVLDSDVPTKDDASIAWNALDLPDFSKE